MMRMLLEIVMLTALVAGVLFVMKVSAAEKENKGERTYPVEEDNDNS